MKEVNVKKANIFTEYVFNVLFNIIYQKRNILAPCNPHKITQKERERYLKFKNFSLLIYPKNILVYSLFLGVIILVNIVHTINDLSLENFTLTMGLIGVEISIVTAAVILQGKLDEYKDARCDYK